MFLREFTAFRLTRKLGVGDLNDLNAALSRRAYRPIGPKEKATDGFMPPLKRYMDSYLVLVGRSEPSWRENALTHTFFETQFVTKDFEFEGFGSPGDALVMQFYREEKHVVSSDIKRKLQAKVEEIEEEEGRKVYARERGELKQALINNVIPHAQSTLWSANICILSCGLIIIGAVGAKAEMIASELRGILGTFPVRHLHVIKPAHEVLTDLARAQAHSLEEFEDMNTFGFKVADDFQMQEMEEKPAIARMKNTCVTDHDVQSMLEGKVMTHANLIWEDGVSFKIDPKFVIRKFRVPDAMFDEVSGSEDDEVDAVGAQYASFMIELDLLRKMLESLIQLFGGEAENMLTHPEAETTLILRNIDEALQLARQPAPDPEADENEAG